MSDVVRIEVVAGQGRPLVVKCAEGPTARAVLEQEADRLTRGRHPGVVEVFRFTPDRLELTWVGAHTLETAHLAVPAAAGVLASVAETVADLHSLGIVHGRLDPSHVVIDAAGRPVLCGLRGPSPGEADPGPAEDVAAIGRLMDHLLGPDAEVEPIPERRWGRRSWAGFNRRSLQVLADRATHEDPARRPTARTLANAIVEAVPDARIRPQHPPTGTESAMPSPPTPSTLETATPAGGLPEPLPDSPHEPPASAAGPTTPTITPTSPTASVSTTASDSTTASTSVSAPTGRDIHIGEGNDQAPDKYFRSDLDDDLDNGPGDDLAPEPRSGLASQHAAGSWPAPCHDDSPGPDPLRAGPFLPRLEPADVDALRTSILGLRIEAEPPAPDAGGRHDGSRRHPPLPGGPPSRRREPGDRRSSPSRSTGRGRGRIAGPANPRVLAGAAAALVALVVVAAVVHGTTGATTDQTATDQIFAGGRRSGARAVDPTGDIDGGTGPASAAQSTSPGTVDAEIGTAESVTATPASSPASPTATPAGSTRPDGATGADTSAAGTDTDAHTGTDTAGRTVLTVDGATYGVGRADDVVSLGDWDCNGSPTVGVVRPATGEVFLFDAWATSDEPLTIAPAAQVRGATALVPPPDPPPTSPGGANPGGACATRVVRSDGTQMAITRVADAWTVAALP